MWWLLVSTIAFSDVSGRVSMDGESLFKKPSPPVSQTKGAFTLSLEAKDKVSENWRWKFEPLVRARTPNKISEESFEWNSRESWAEYRQGIFKLQAGSLVKAWEGTDGLNPMDIATQKNLTDPIRSENLGSWGLWSQTTGEVLSFEAMWIPDQTRSVLPGDNSGWFPRESELPMQKDSQRLLLPENPEYEILKRTSENRAYQHNYGARLRAQFEKLDLSLAYFEGATQTPTLRPSTIQSDVVELSPILIVRMRNPIQIQPIDDRRRTTAAGLNFTTPSFIFRGAIRYDTATNKDNTLLTDTHQAVAGVEKTTEISRKTVIFVFQYAWGKASQSATSAVSVQNLFSQAWLGGVRAMLSDQASLQISAVSSVATKSSFEQIDLDYRLRDNVVARGGLDFFQGPKDSLIGLWGAQSRARVGLDFIF